MPRYQLRLGSPSGGGRDLDIMVMCAIMSLKQNFSKSEPEMEMRTTFTLKPSCFQVCFFSLNSSVFNIWLRFLFAPCKT